MTSPSSAPFRRLPLCCHLEWERWFEGEGYKAMHVQGRRWSGDMGGRSDCRHSRDLVLQLVERILSGPKARTILLNGAVRKGERIVPPAVLDLLMRATFPASTARVKLALTGSGTKTTKQASQQLLPFAIQAIQENNFELTKEVTDLFIWCLTQNAECYKQWEKLYVENVGATIIVLRKLSTEWRNYSAKISLDTLKVTLKHLRAKNEDALSRNTDPSQVASIKEADKYCKTILMKLTRNFGCMKGSVLVLVLGIASCSYCYLLSIPPMLRKYGFHLVLSGNRYYISNQLKKNIKRHEHMHEASEVTERTKCNFEGCERTFSNVSNLRQHIKAVHQNLRPFACRFSKCGQKFPYKHVRDNHEKSGVHSYIQDDFLEIDEQWQSRPRGGWKRKCPSIGSFCRKRIVSPEQASTLMYNVLRNMMQAEFCWWDEIE
ncbi:hypothetical protein ZIOFF_021374 [Zingiber officinale]|uniref:C2H2-type domain-containing protein n=1 Tax=Zingiber officinale TaxID=94328 RepID=A0A8J5H1N9_ZINOF|nr:hypothetical protein ZIOFF_021374 [Zingiber officinale]